MEAAATAAAEQQTGSEWRIVWLLRPAAFRMDQQLRGTKTKHAHKKKKKKRKTPTATQNPSLSSSVLAAYAWVREASGRTGSSRSVCERFKRR